MVDIYSRIWAQRATCLCWLPGCSLRNSALSKSELPRLQGSDGLESGVHVSARTACGPGSGEEGRLGVVLSAGPAQAGEGSGTPKEATRHHRELSRKASWKRWAWS